MTDKKLTFLGVEYTRSGYIIDATSAHAEQASSKVAAVDGSFTYTIVVRGKRTYERGYATRHQAAIAADEEARAELERMRMEIDKLLQTEPMRETE